LSSNIQIFKKRKNNLQFLLDGHIVLHDQYMIVIFKSTIIF